MRSLFVFLIAISSLAGFAGCTRANPDAFTLPLLDLATSGTGGNGGGSGVAGGGGSGGGGGGIIEGDDLAVEHDLAVESHDMAESTSGIKCGSTTCSAASKDSCCLTTNSATCVDANMSCMNGVTVSCDGPEDCTTSGGTCCATGTNSAAGSKGATCGSNLTPGCVPLCHTLTDCPAALPAYTVCCATTGAPYAHCSRTACK